MLGSIFNTRAVYLGLNWNELQRLCQLLSRNINIKCNDVTNACVLYNVVR